MDAKWQHNKDILHGLKKTNKDAERYIKKSNFETKL